jgi:hypothetical protein
MGFGPRDFKSLASTSFATRATTARIFPESKANGLKVRTNSQTGQDADKPHHQSCSPVARFV